MVYNTFKSWNYMKRYIFLSAWCMLFCTAMNFGMDQTESLSSLAWDVIFTVQKNGIPIHWVNSDSGFTYQDGEVVMVSKKSTDKREICKLKSGKPLKPLKITQ